MSSSDQMYHSDLSPPIKIIDSPPDLIDKCVSAAVKLIEQHNSYYLVRLDFLTKDELKLLFQMIHFNLVHINCIFPC